MSMEALLIVLMAGRRSSGRCAIALVLHQGMSGNRPRRINELLAAAGGDAGDPQRRVPRNPRSDDQIRRDVRFLYPGAGCAAHDGLAFTVARGS